MNIYDYLVNKAISGGSSDSGTRIKIVIENETDLEFNITGDIRGIEPYNSHVIYVNNSDFTEAEAYLTPEIVDGYATAILWVESSGESYRDLILQDYDHDGNICGFVHKTKAISSRSDSSVIYGYKFVISCNADVVSNIEFLGLVRDAS